MLGLHKSGRAMITGLAIGLGLSVPTSARALTYVSLLEEPSPPEVHAALVVGVDIDVYFTVYNERTGKNEWWPPVRFPDQHTLDAARQYIRAQLEDNKRLPPHKQHVITIGWHRR